MSSIPPATEELARLLGNVLAETPTATGGEAAGRRGEEVGEGSSFQARINRLTFAETGDRAESESRVGTSQRRVDSLFIDITSSGMESSEGLQMLSARSMRSTGNSTIDSILDVTPLKYEVYQFPKTLQELDQMCNQRQSGGITACTRLNCKMKHRGPRIAFREGSIVVARSAKAVFIDPVTHHTNISNALYLEWKKTPRGLDEWNELFCLVNAQEPSEVFTPTSLTGHKMFSEYAQEWRSPRGRVRVDDLPFGTKSDIFSKIMYAEVVSHTETFTKENTEVEDLDNDEEGEDEHGVGRIPPTLLKTGERSVNEAFKRLELNGDINTSILTKVTEELDERSDLLNEEMRVLLTRVQRSESVIGPKVVPDNPNFDAPSIWGSIATLASAMDELQSQVAEIKATRNQELAATEKRVKDDLEDQLQEVITNAQVMITEQISYTQEKVGTNTSSIESANQTILLLARGANKLKDEISDIRTGLEKTKTSDRSGTAVTDDSTVVSDISSLKVMIRTMGTRIDHVIESRESKMIKFFGASFRGHTEAEEWVSEHLDNDSYGLIVDAHLVFEHVFHQAFSDDGSLKELNGLYKIKIDNLTQGLAMSSFDFPIPKFMSTPVNGLNKKPKIKKPDSSHFDNIDNWDDWDMPINGFRAKLHEQLDEFEATHVRLIGEVLGVEETAYRVATMSVQTSVMWIQGFVAYIDATYRETSRLQSFTKERAWQLVTQIGRRILNDVAVPRNGVKKLFRVGDNTRIAQAMFWPMVQSHEIMTRFKNANFKDDPAVSNEFMKFMATNSGSTDGLTSITMKMSKLEGDVKDAFKNSKGANTSATANANKTDELKKLLTSLVQRVTILEKSK